MTKPKIGDYIVIAIILIITAGVFGFRLFGFGEGQTVVVSTDTEEYTYSLSEDRRVSLTSNGMSLTLVIENNSVRVEDAECPNHDCENMGTVSKNGEVIACVPAKVYIKIAEGGSVGHDAILG